MFPIPPFPCHLCLLTPARETLGISLCILPWSFHILPSTSPAKAIWTSDCSIFCFPLQLWNTFEYHLYKLLKVSDWISYLYLKVSMSQTNHHLDFDISSIWFSNFWHNQVSWSPKVKPSGMYWTPAFIQVESFCLISKLPDSPHSASGHGSLMSPCYSGSLLPFWSQDLQITSPAA